MADKIVLIFVVLIGICIHNAFPVSATRDTDKMERLKTILKNRPDKASLDKKTLQINTAMSRTKELVVRQDTTNCSDCVTREEFDAMVATVTVLQSEVAQIAFDVEETGEEIAQLEIDLMAEIDSVRATTLARCETGYIGYQCYNDFPLPNCCLAEICRNDGYFEFDKDITFSQAFTKVPTVLISHPGELNWEALSFIDNHPTDTATTTTFHVHAYILAFETQGHFQWLACA